jgi:hypothetical protein
MIPIVIFQRIGKHGYMQCNITIFDMDVKTKTGGKHGYS